MNGWGGHIASVISTALDALPDLTVRDVGDQLVKLGDMWVQSAGAVVDGEASQTPDGSFMQVREVASIAVCVQIGSADSQLNLYPIFRAAREAVSQAGYLDPEVSLPGEVVYLPDAASGKPASVQFEVSGRMGQKL